MESQQFMPNSAKSRRPYKGNTFLIQSREYQDINRRLNQLLVTVQQLQSVVALMMTGPEGIQPEQPSTIVVDESAEIPQETWDAIETETERLAAEAANEAVYEALLPQEAPPVTQASV
jgi:hypothetical protein